MKREEQQKRRRPFYLQGSAVFLLLFLSVLIIACGTSNTATKTDLSGPQVTVTISFGNNGTSQPAIPPYLCGAWITNTTPSFNPGDQIPIYAHFVHSVNGNPVGVGGANAQATMQWADGYRDAQSATTTSDGLAVFYFTIPDRPSMINKNNLVTVSFNGPSGETCNVDNQAQPAAFFTLIQASPTPAPMPSPTPSQDAQGATPSIISTAIDILTPNNQVPSGKKGRPQPTPTTPCDPSLPFSSC